MPELQWARLQAGVNCKVRRGAWYRVLAFRALEVVLDVHGKVMAVPRPFVELAARPPQRWTIVPRPSDAVRLPREWGERYAVCPSCRSRQRVSGRPASMRCQHCNGLFDLAWKEPYLAVG